MIKTPEWRKKPQPVFVNLLKAVDFPAGDDEYIVQFQNHEGHFTSFVPKKYVIPEEKYLYAAIIADVDGGVLVDIPNETLTSGPRLLVLDSEVEEVLTLKDWTVKNGSQ